MQNLVIYEHDIFVPIINLAVILQNKCSTSSLTDIY